MNNWNGLAIVLGAAMLAFSGCKTRTNNENAKVNIFGWSKAEKEAKAKAEAQELYRVTQLIYKRSLDKVSTGSWTYFNAAGKETIGKCHLIGDLARVDIQLDPKSEGDVGGRLWSGFQLVDNTFSIAGNFYNLNWLIIESKSHKLAKEMAQENPGYRALAGRLDGVTSKRDRIVYDSNYNIKKFQELDDEGKTVYRECVLNADVERHSEEWKMLIARLKDEMKTY